MSDDAARALGAAGGKTVMIAGKECRVRPLGIRELTEAERECLSCYRRSYVKTFAETADLVPDGRDRVIQAQQEAARWDVDDLPSKKAFDRDSIRVTAELKDWLKDHLKLDEELEDERAARLAVGLLDQETVKPADIEKLAGQKPRQMQIPYVNWWITGCFDGMVTFTWLCFRPSGVTKEEVAEAMSANPAMLMELSQEIEKLSTPEVGNG